MTISPRKICVLYLEDSALDVELAIQELQKNGKEIDYVITESKKGFLSALKDKSFDLILADYNLPSFDGISALKLVQERNLDIPFILVSGSIGEEAAIDSLRAGAVDYVLKTRLSRLGPVVERALLEADERHQRRKAEEQAQHYLQHLVAANKLALGLGETLELSEIYQTIYNDISQLMDVDSFAISTYEPEEKLIKVKYAMRDGVQVDVGTIPVIPVQKLGKSRQGDVIHTGKPLYLDDYQQVSKKSQIEDGVTSHRGVTKLSLEMPTIVKSALYAPMKNRGKPIGVMQVQSYQMDAYQQDDIDLLCSLANVASISIQNAALIQDLEQANEEIAEAYDSTLEGWSKALELRDMETEGHSRRVVDLALKLAKKMGVKGDNLVQVQRGALLHDIGKMSVPDNILQKPGKLNEEEWEVMRLHPMYAYHWLSPIKYLRPCLDIPRYHHEKWDGTGYPRGLKGKLIPLSARIFAIVDVWDALLSDRPYREAWSRDRAIDYIAYHSEKHFDPEVVKAFLRLVAAEKKESE